MTSAKKVRFKAMIERPKLVNVGNAKAVTEKVAENVPCVKRELKVSNFKKSVHI